MQPKDLGLPTTAYYTTDEIREVGLLQMMVAALPTLILHARCAFTAVRRR